jgi:hypothetical protein
MVPYFCFFLDNKINEQFRAEVFYHGSTSTSTIAYSRIYASGSDSLNRQLLLVHGNLLLSMSSPHHRKHQCTQSVQGREKKTDRLALSIDSTRSFTRLSVKIPTLVDIAASKTAHLCSCWKGKVQRHALLNPRLKGSSSIGGLEEL